MSQMQGCTHRYGYGNRLFTCTTALSPSEDWILEGRSFCEVHAPLKASMSSVAKSARVGDDPEGFVERLAGFIAQRAGQARGRNGVLDLSGMIVPVDCDLGSLIGEALKARPGVHTLVLAHAYFGAFVALNLPVGIRNVVLEDVVFCGKADLTGWKVSSVAARGLRSKTEITLSVPDAPLWCDRLDLSEAEIGGVLTCRSAKVLSVLSLRKARFSEGSTLTLAGSAAAQLVLSDLEVLGNFDITRFRAGHSISARGMRAARPVRAAQVSNRASRAGALATLLKSEGLGMLEQANFLDGPQGIDFRDATFEAGGNFSGLHVEGAFDISCSRRSNSELIDMKFDGAVFCGESLFRNRDFHGELDYRSCEFRVAPQFSGSTLSRDVTFRNAQFLDVSTRGATDRYRAIRRELRESESAEDFELFIRLETDSRWMRRKELPFWETPVLFIFRELFDYGADVGRAATTIFINWLFGTAVYFLASVLLQAHYACRTDLNNTFCGLSFGQEAAALLLAVRVSAHGAIIPFSFLANWPDVSPMVGGTHAIMLQLIIISVGLVQGMISAMLWLSVAWAIAWKVSKD